MVVRWIPLRKKVVKKDSQWDSSIFERKKEYRRVKVQKAEYVSYSDYGRCGRGERGSS